MKSVGIYDLELKSFKSWKWRETRFSFWALKFQSSYQKVVPFCRAAKILITKGYDVETLTIHIKVTVDLQGSNFAKIIFFAYSKAEKGIYNLV